MLTWQTSFSGPDSTIPCLYYCFSVIHPVRPTPVLPSPWKVGAKELELIHTCVLYPHKGIVNIISSGDSGKARVTVSFCQHCLPFFLM